MTPEQLAKRNTEAGHQTAYFCWCAQQRPIDDRYAWIHAIPNGGSRDIKEATNLVAQGVRSGVPDVCVPIPVPNHPSLYIEFKKPKLEGKKHGGLAVNQQRFRIYCLSQGFAHFVAYTWLQAAEATVHYLSLGENDHFPIQEFKP